MVLSGIESGVYKVSVRCRLYLNQGVRQTGRSPTHCRHNMKSQALKSAEKS